MRFKRGAYAWVGWIHKGWASYCRDRRNSTIFTEHHWICIFCKDYKAGFSAVSILISISVRFFVKTALKTSIYPNTARWLVKTVKIVELRLSLSYWEALEDWNFGYEYLNAWQKWRNPVFNPRIIYDVIVAPQKPWFSIQPNWPVVLFSFLDML